MLTFSLYEVFLSRSVYLGGVFQLYHQREPYAISSIANNAHQHIMRLVINRNNYQ